MRIAISGLSGVGSSTTARLVAEKLQLPMNNFTFRDFAKERGVPFEELQKQAATDPSIDLELDRRLIRFIQENPTCLIATDLACWLDHPSLYKKLGLNSGAEYDLKIWLEAPEDIRAERLHRREGGEFEAVKTYNHQRDLENRERYLALYGVDIFDHSDIDWILDSTHLTLEEVVDLIVARLSTILQANTVTK